MDKSAIRVNVDQDTGEGLVVSTPQQSVFVNGELMAVAGAMTTPHGEEGDVGVFSGGSGTVFAESTPVSREEDAIDCEHTVVEASEDVFVGD